MTKWWDKKRDERAVITASNVFLFLLILLLSYLKSRPLERAEEVSLIGTRGGFPAWMCGIP